MTDKIPEYPCRVRFEKVLRLLRTQFLLRSGDAEDLLFNRVEESLLTQGVSISVSSEKWLDYCESVDALLHRTYPGECSVWAKRSYETGFCYCTIYCNRDLV